MDKQAETKIEEIIKEAGKIMLSARYKNMNVDEKTGCANFVTEYDVLVQKFLEEKFLELIPEAKFLAEEEGEDENKVGDGLTFIIDPIDGTSNFMYNMNLSAISVAIAKDKKTVFAAIYNPYADEYFTAKRGEGAYLNGGKISVSSVKASSSLALIGTAAYYKDSIGDKTVKMFEKVFYSFGDIRRCGSAAIDLCNIAKGSASAFFEYVLSPWDYAAGALIVTEAGGYITDFKGESLLDRYEKSTVLAANAVVFDEAKEIVEKIY